MTQTLAADANGDLYLGADGKIAVLSGLAAVQQLCDATARTLLGECMFNVDEGLPYFQAVWTGVPNLAQYEAALRSAITAVDGVLSITDLALSHSGDKLSYSMSISTVYGAGAASGSV